MRAESSISARAAPAPGEFPAYPASWYLFGASRECAERPLSKRMLGRELVAFRTASGRFVVAQANCAHMGADLGCGKVVGEAIQCPFHGWRYGADGKCRFVPGGMAIPAFARLQVYPAVERHGYLFFFNGPEALFPLPFFFGEDPAAFVAGKVFSYVANTSWYMNAAHAFDLQHFASVHERELIAAPQIDEPAPYARRNRYRAKVVGASVLDRLLRVFAGRTVEITLSICGGTFALVTGDFGKAYSRFLIATRPLEDGRTLCEGICFARRSRVPLANRAGLALRRIFTHGYLDAESRQLRGTRYNPASLGENDRDMIDFFHWVVSLPQAAPSATQPLLREKNNESHDRSVAASVRPSPAAGRVAAGER
jgi:nitrite reductase/ring-hydroxylating ferredoxin subunit